MPPCIMCKICLFFSQSNLISFVYFHHQLFDKRHLLLFPFNFTFSRRRHEITMEEFLTNQRKLRCNYYFLSLNKLMPHYVNLSFYIFFVCVCICVSCVFSLTDSRGLNPATTDSAKLLTRSVFSQIHPPWT